MPKKFTAVLEQKYEIQQNGTTVRMRTVSIKNHKGKTIQTLQTINNPLDFEIKLKENGWQVVQQINSELFEIAVFGKEAEKNQKEEMNKKAVMGCCSILGGILVIVFLIGLISFSNYEPTPEGKSEISAEVYCEEAAKTQILETPSTAKFSNMRAIHTGDIQGEDTWKVMGHVEYDNAIGGRSGSDFRCTLKYDQAADQWSGRATFE